MTRPGAGFRPTTTRRRPGAPWPSSTPPSPPRWPRPTTWSRCWPATSRRRAGPSTPAPTGSSRADGAPDSGIGGAATPKGRSGEGIPGRPLRRLGGSVTAGSLVAGDLDPVGGGPLALDQDQLPPAGHAGGVLALGEGERVGEPAERLVLEGPQTVEDLGRGGVGVGHVLGGELEGLAGDPADGVADAVDLDRPVLALGVAELGRGGIAADEVREAVGVDGQAVEVGIVLHLVEGDGAEDAEQRLVVLPGAGGGDAGHAVAVEGDLEDLDAGVAGADALGGEVRLGERGPGLVDELQPGGLDVVGVAVEAVGVVADLGFGAGDEAVLLHAF